MTARQSAGMVARGQHASQIESNSSFQLMIKSVSFVSPPDRMQHRGLCVVYPPGGWHNNGRAQASSILGQRPLPKDIFSSRPCKKHNGTDPWYMVGSVAPILNL